jgi:hypothetical protein
MLKVFMDESGTHCGSPVVTVGAYIAKPSHWQAWQKEWNRLKKPIRVVHAADCANQDGEFKDWDQSKRFAFAAKMIPVIPKHIPMGVAIGINLRAFEKAMAPHPELRMMVGSPYGACFQWVVQTLINKMEEYRDNQRIAFFHEQNDYEEEATKAFEWVKQHRPEKRRPISLKFGGKHEYVPLQAADILAYEANHVIRDPAAKRRKSWTALSPDDGGIELLQYGEPTMHELVSRLSSIRRRLLASGWDGKVE